MRPIVVIGAGGQLGEQLVRVFSQRGSRLVALGRPDFDITRAADLRRLEAFRPRVIINAAAWTDVDGCARHPLRAMQINGHAPGVIAATAQLVGALMVQVSTNEVFDGELDRPYTEDDDPRPINAYGNSKLAGEEAVAREAERHLIVRSAWIYGGPRSFPTRIRAAAERARATDQPLRVVADEFGNPTPAAALAERIADALSPPNGAMTPTVLHLAGEPPASRFEWATRILVKGTPIEPIRQEDYPRASRPPRRAVLDTRLATSLGLRPVAWQDNPG